MRRMRATTQADGTPDIPATARRYLQLLAFNHLELAVSAGKDPRCDDVANLSYTAAGVLLLASVFAENEHQPLLLADILTPVTHPVVVDHGGTDQTETVLRFAIKAISDEIPSRYCVGGELDDLVATGHSDPSFSVVVTETLVGQPESGLANDAPESGL